MLENFCTYNHLEKIFQANPQFLDYIPSDKNFRLIKRDYIFNVIKQSINKV